MNQKTYYSHGKLLLTGEYMILHGALGLAIPIVKGQSLTVYTKKKYSNVNFPYLLWKSYDELNKIWFKVIFKLPEFKIYYHTNIKIAVRLKNLLKISKQINNKFLLNSLETCVVTKLDFPITWGFGSSATLINNLSKWIKINPYMLLKDFFFW